MLEKSGSRHRRIVGCGNQQSAAYLSRARRVLHFSSFVNAFQMAGSNSVSALAKLEGAHAGAYQYSVAVRGKQRRWGFSRLTPERGGRLVGTKVRKQCHHGLVVAAEVKGEKRRKFGV